MGLSLSLWEVLLLWQSCKDVFLIGASRNLRQLGLVNNMSVQSGAFGDLVLGVRQLDWGHGVLMRADIAVGITVLGSLMRLLLWVGGWQAAHARRKHLLDCAVLWHMVPVPHTVVVGVVVRLAQLSVAFLALWLLVWLDPLRVSWLMDASWWVNFGAVLLGSSANWWVVKVSGLEPTDHWLGATLARDYDYREKILHMWSLFTYHL